MPDLELPSMNAVQDFLTANGGSEPATPPAAPTPTDGGQGAAAAASQPASPTAPDQQAATNVADLSDDTKVKLADGTITTLGEMRNGYLRQSDYTRKTQEAAKLRQQASDYVQQAQAEMQKQWQTAQGQLQSWLQDPSNLFTLTEQLTGLPVGQILQQFQQHQQQIKQAEQQQFITQGQAQQLTQQELQRMQQQIAQAQQQLQGWTQEQIAQATNELQVRQEAASHSQKINAVLSDIFEEYPALKAVGDMEDMLRFRVIQRQPETLDDAIAAFREEAKAQAEKLDAYWTESTKQRLTNKEKLANGIEPPGGTGVTPAPQQFKMGDKSLTQAVEAYLQQSLQNTGL